MPNDANKPQKSLTDKQDEDNISYYNRMMARALKESRTRQVPLDGNPVKKRRIEPEIISREIASDDVSSYKMN